MAGTDPRHNKFIIAVTVDNAAVLADLDPELDGLPFGVPAGILGEGKVEL